MTVIYSAAFTAADFTNITSYSTPEVGSGAFTAHPQYGSSAGDILNNAFRNQSGSGSCFVTPVPTVSDDQTVEWTLRVVTAEEYVGVAVRVHPTDHTLAFVDYDGAGGQFRIVSIIGGSASIIATVPYAVSAGDYACALHWANGAQELTVNGVSQWTGTENDPAFTGLTGTALRCSGAPGTSSGLRIDNFVVSDTSTPPPPSSSGNMLLLGVS